VTTNLKNTAPDNALTPVERAEIVRLCNFPGYSSLSPTQITQRRKPHKGLIKS